MCYSVSTFTPLSLVPLGSCPLELLGGPALCPHTGLEGPHLSCTAGFAGPWVW